MLQYCTVNGRWEQWSSWSMSTFCTKTCGRGTQTFKRSRQCNNPTPKYGGRTCYGSRNEYKHNSCFIKKCPVDGVWKNWSTWASQGWCSVTCGKGVLKQSRSRSCNGPKYGGRDCIGKKTEIRVRDCSKDFCPVNGAWSSWGEWEKIGKCSVTCGNGQQKYMRTHKCNNPTPRNGGKDCDQTKAKEIKHKKCVLKDCPFEDHPVCMEKTCSRYGECGCAFGFYGNGFNCKGSQGKRFLVLFMETIDVKDTQNDSNRSTEILIASQAASKLSLDSSNNYLLKSLNNRINSINKGATTLSIPARMRSIDFKTENKAMILESSEPVSVFTLNHDGYSSDSTLILPTDRLGTKYVVGSTEPYSSRDSSHKSQVAIAALHNDTTVKVTLKLKSKGTFLYQNLKYRNGDKINFKLNRLENFQFSHTSDLTGTFVESNKPIAVFSGNRCNKLQRFGYCSHLIEQLPPVDNLDNQFIVPPSLESSGTRVRIVAAKKTKVIFHFDDSKREKVLKPGTSKDVEIYGHHSIYIQADGPIMVLSFAVRLGRRGEGDPYMSVVPGFNQYLSGYYILVPNGYTKNYLSIMVKAASKAKLRIDDKALFDDNISSEIRVQAEREKYLVLIVRVDAGGHKVETLDKSRFGLMIHGQKDGDSYGYAANIIKVS
ncbi:uncharacterized protein LOC133187646 [Saccostrea echinata]|uniref:uncharacterized protein LOC133187646 n=1 Tax=Saccostrea echinata TaxID=191078 RepID=UPI002A826ACC|nr:uncharacterized protein LOC133187646 [Saccostrea echinata]